MELNCVHSARDNVALLNKTPDFPFNGNRFAIDFLKALTYSNPYKRIF